MHLLVVVGRGGKVFLLQGLPPFELELLLLDEESSLNLSLLNPGKRLSSTYPELFLSFSIRACSNGGTAAVARAQGAK